MKQDVSINCENDMNIDMLVLKWTAMGMRKEGIGEYIEKREVDRLLADEFMRGYDAGIKAGIEQAEGENK